MIDSGEWLLWRSESLFWTDSSISGTIWLHGLSICRAVKAPTPAMLPLKGFTSGRFASNVTGVPQLRNDDSRIPVALTKQDHDTILE
ncbi:hypothetical protein LZ30DRAFT_734678 [Colletotrichum cereale]|nr:hypothetical protein LZ30DRAFT_734678 [Colletotrichum cereale]